MPEEGRPPGSEGEGFAPNRHDPAKPWLAFLLVALVSIAAGVGGTALFLRARPRTAPEPPSPSAKAGAAPGHEGMPGMPGMEADAGGEHPTETGGQTVYISPARQQLIGVRTAVIEPHELGTTLRTVGTLAYDETRVAQIHTKISGWVEHVYVDYIGKDIRRGAALLTVYSPELVSTQTEYLLALRNKAQFEGSAIATTRVAADSLLAAARDRLKLWDVPEEHIKELEQSGQVQRTMMIHSPFSGIVLERSVFPGQYITPEMTTFKVADLSSIWALGAIFEYELPLIKLGQEAEIEFPYGQANRSLKGKITFIAPEIDPQTRRVRIRAEFPNPGQTLKPETYVTVVVHTEGGRLLSIPKEAVIDNGAKQYALVAHPNGYFTPAEIKVGPPSDDFYPLLSGLKEGDTVVSSAQFLIDSETNLQAAMQSMIGMPGMDMKGGGDTKGPKPKAMPSTTPPASPSGEHSDMPGMDMTAPSAPPASPAGGHKSHQQ
jgi:membrane fusion protein, copper/silver efflux system